MLRKPPPARLDVLFLCVAAAFLALILRLVQLQVFLGEAYTALARENAVREVLTPVPRGRILDRRGVVLAADRVSLTAYLQPGEAFQPGEALTRLALLFGPDDPGLHRAFQSLEYRVFPAAYVLPDLDPRTYTRLAEREPELSGLSLGWEPVREYPLGPVAAHVVGYLGEVSARDVFTYPDLYRPGDLRGVTGVEAACDWLLRGRAGRTVHEVDAAGHSTTVLLTQEGEPGLDVRLTLDAVLQRAAYESLSAALTRLGGPSETSGGARPGGAVVVLDPRTGAVLALVSQPSFDPNLLVLPGPRSEAAGLYRDPSSPFLDRVSRGLYAPGSAFKVVTAAAALEAGVTTTGEAVVDTGTHPRIPKRCWKPGGHGRVRLREALMVSCNVYFYEMGLRLGIDRLASMARRFGLGRPVGLDLYAPRGALGPGRSGPVADGDPAGTVPGPEAKAAAFPDDPTFWPAEVMDAAIGEGLHAHTPLHLALLTAALANGGTLYRPYVIDEVLDRDGLTLVRAKPEVAGELGLSPGTLLAVREAMRGAAMGTSPVRGTAASVFGPAFEARWGVSVAGKTGTHERTGSGEDDDGWFICFVPYGDPRLAIAVVVEQGGSGAGSAAPVARAVIEAWLLSRENPEPD